MKKYFLFFFYVIFLCILCSAQDFTDIHKKKPFQIGGDISFQSQLKPLGFLISANIRPKIYGIEFPLGITFGSDGFAYSQAFTQFSFSPSYKWIKLYLGKTSMSFSPYSLSAHSFTGAGIELTPSEYISVSALYGQFQKAKEGDSALGIAPLLKRTAYGLKLSSQYRKQVFSVHFFRALDHASSFVERGDSLFVKRNTVWGADVDICIYENFRMSGSVGISRYADYKSQALSTYTAYKLSLNYKIISLSFERVSPNYKSLGIPYFTNDFQNIVCRYNQSFKKVQVFADLGLQYDDLAKKKNSRMFRWVGSLNLQYQILPQLQTSFSYSNFTTHTQTKPVQLGQVQDPLVVDTDTLAYREISQQAQWSLHYTKAGGVYNSEQFSFQFSFQESRMLTQLQSVRYYYAYAQYQRTLWKLYQFIPSLNFSANEDGQTASFTMGPSAQFSRSFFERKLYASTSLQYYLNFSSENIKDHILGLRLQASFVLAEKHQFSLHLILQYKTLSPFDTSLQFSYQYRF